MSVVAPTSSNPVLLIAKLIAAAGNKGKVTKFDLQVVLMAVKNAKQGTMPANQLVACSLGLATVKVMLKKQGSSIFAGKLGKIARISKHLQRCAKPAPPAHDAITRSFGQSTFWDNKLVTSGSGVVKSNINPPAKSKI